MRRVKRRTGKESDSWGVYHFLYGVAVQAHGERELARNPILKMQLRRLHE
jgi:hypothetical protein